MKKKYLAPSINISCFKGESVLTLSGITNEQSVTSSVEESISEIAGATGTAGGITTLNLVW